MRWIIWQLLLAVITGTIETTTTRDFYREARLGGNAKRGKSYIVDRNCRNIFNVAWIIVGLENPRLFFEPLCGIMCHHAKWHGSRRHLKGKKMCWFFKITYEKFWWEALLFVSTHSLVCLCLWYFNRTKSEYIFFHQAHGDLRRQYLRFCSITV